MPFLKTHPDGFLVYEDKELILALANYSDAHFEQMDEWLEVMRGSEGKREVFACFTLLDSNGEIS